MRQHQSKRKIRLRLIKNLLLGTIAILAAIYFVYSATGNPYHEYLLITKGVTTTGLITDADEMVENRDDGGVYFSHYYSYTFKIANGKELISHGKGEGRLPEELTDLRKPSPIEVIYLQSNPEVNKIKNTISKSISELLWAKVGLGMVLLIAFSSIGYVLIKNAIKEYSSATKKQVPL
jgi:hypothetical protein